MGKIATLGAVVADAYEEQTPSEWSSSSKPARAAPPAARSALCTACQEHLRMRLPLREVAA